MANPEPGDPPEPALRPPEPAPRPSDPALRPPAHAAHPPAHAAHPPAHAAHLPGTAAHPPAHAAHLPGSAAHPPEHAAHPPAHAAHPPGTAAHPPAHAAHPPEHAAHSPEHAAHPSSRLKRLLKSLWWLHSLFALSFGVGVMLFARAGLAHADKILVALFASWLVMFVALRFIVGPANRREQEGLTRKGVRVATNYIIKQFYQQMFFFLTPLYALSATWSVSYFNWWIAPVLLACAVVSTLDLIFDNFIMERRLLASAMYGLAMFGVLNVMLPLVGGLDHRSGLVIAACATPASVALLSYSIRQVASPQGALLTVASTCVLVALVWFGRVLIPPAPLAMPEAAVGHGTASSYECLPPSKRVIRAHQLDGLRCGSLLREPGGIKEPVVHVWSLDGREIERVTPARLPCDGDDNVFVSHITPGRIPSDPTGRWTCTTMTEGGQLVGVRKFSVISKDAPLPGLPFAPLTGTGTGTGSGAGSAGSSAGSAGPGAGSAGPGAGSARSPEAGSTGGGAGSARSPGASGSATGQAGGSAR